MFFLANQSKMLLSSSQPRCRAWTWTGSLRFVLNAFCGLTTTVHTQRARQRRGRQPMLSPSWRKRGREVLRNRFAGIFWRQRTENKNPTNERCSTPRKRKRQSTPPLPSRTTSARVATSLRGFVHHICFPLVSRSRSQSRARSRSVSNPLSVTPPRVWPRKVLRRQSDLTKAARFPWRRFWTLMPRTSYRSQQPP